jgi:hypothetical protein
MSQMTTLLFIFEGLPWWRDPIRLGAVFTGVIAVETFFYVIFTIGLWKATKRSADAASLSADAARVSADAAKQSAEVAIELHRPFMGLERIRLQGDRNSRTWVIAWTVMNFGSLPALKVDAVLELNIGPTQWTGRGPNSVEIFPQAESESLVRFVFPEQIHPDVITGNQILQIRASIEYDSAEDQHYRYSADAQYNHETDAFMVFASQTQSV